jgi:DeoR family transcriptional regulator of aga operon
MRQEERLSLILERLSQTGSVGVSGIAAELGVSTASVRRDLAASRRTAPAVAHPRRRRRQCDRLRAAAALPQRQPHRREAAHRRRGGRARIDDTVATVGMTGGTTTTEVARRLADRLGLTVVTNALNIASDLALHPDIKLIVTGGTARSESYELVGPLAESTLADLNLDIVVVGVDGISVGGGLTTYHEVEAATNRAMIGRARRVIVVADGSKVGKLALARICDAEAVDELITGDSADDAELTRLETAGMTVTRT